MPEFFVNDQRPDDDGTLQYYPRITSYEQLQQYIPIKVTRQYGWDATPAGQMCWKIIGFNVRTAAPIFFPRVLGQNGAPYYNPATNTTALVYHTWAGCDDFPSPEPLRPDYNPVLAGLTDSGFAVHHALYNWSKREEGDADFAFGLGMQYGPGMKGAGAVWVSAFPAHIDPTVGPQYSDCAYNMGWVGGTNYFTAAPVFQMLKKEGGTTPPPIPPTTGDQFLMNIDKDGNIIGWMVFTPGGIPTPSDGQAKLGLWMNGGVVAYLNWNPGQPTAGLVDVVKKFLSKGRSSA